MILYFFIFFIILYFIIKYNYLLFEYFDDDIYNYKYSDIFKNMFTQPTIWLGYQDFDGNEKIQKLFINNYDIGKIQNN